AITIGKNLTIAGPGADAMIVSGGGVFVNSGVTAAVSGLTISDGAGIRNSGNLILTDSTVRRNKGQNLGGTISGGGILNFGTLTVAGSVISENDVTLAGGIYAGLGGGIYNGGGTVTITDSTVSQNTAKRGGGIYNDVNGSVTVNNSTITGNLGGSTVGNADRGGGGLTNVGGILTLTNSTVSSNLARVICTDVCPSAAGIKNESGSSGQNTITGQVNLINTTVADNIENSPSNATVNARNSIVASFNGTLNSQGYNLINTSNTTITGVTTGNLLNMDARLGPLGYYGGLTQTQALLSGSPAINAGNTATSPARDQRGAPRVGTADIGAFELNNSANGGNFVARLPDAFTQIAYSYLINQGGGSNSLSGGAPSGFSLINEGYVSIGGRTNQIGVFNFSVTTTSGTTSFVTNYSIRVLDSGLPPLPGGCLANPVVTNKLNAGDGSLRQAVYDACAGGTIRFSAAARGTIELTSGRIIIDKNLTIQGPGAGVLKIRNAAARSGNGIFGVNSGVTAVISGLTAGDGYYQGITNFGTLTLTNMTVTDNISGGIINNGTLTVADSIISRNGASFFYNWGIINTPQENGSGGIRSSFTASLTVTGSTISDNVGEASGGIYGSSVTITNSTIRNNDASSSGGGGLFIPLGSSGTSTITNSTVSGNYAGDGSFSAGGINNLGGTLRLINSTVAYNKKGNGNDYGVGIYNNATLILRNSIIAMNIGELDIYSLRSVTSEGYNLIRSNNATITGDTTGNILNTDARLSPLGFYGGPTETHA
ncbi:MAG: hypothetical protein H0U13_15850, partial [Gemmatimonadaceae bacterium]|nr:hypothetical protein [Gemmatimonadaceae bacterium]